jgi:hypothetical protein
MLTIFLVKSRRMRWAGHAARMGRGEVHIGMWWRNLRDRDYFEDLVLGGRIILIWTGLIWLRIGNGGVLL